MALSRGGRSTADRTAKTVNNARRAADMDGDPATAGVAQCHAEWLIGSQLRGVNQPPHIHCRACESLLRAEFPRSGCLGSCLGRWAVLLLAGGGARGTGGR